MVGLLPIYEMLFFFSSFYVFKKHVVLLRYRKDENKTPPESVLLPITTHLKWGKVLKMFMNYDDWQHLRVMQDLCNKACPDHWALIIEVKDDLHWNCLLFAKRHFLNKRQPKLQARDSGIWWAQNENMKKPGSHQSTRFLASLTDSLTDKHHF